MTDPVSVEALVDDLNLIAEGRLSGPGQIRPIARAAAEALEATEKARQLWRDIHGEDVLTLVARAEKAEAHLAALRGQRGAREQVLERRAEQAEALAKRREEERDALSADLRYAREAWHDIDKKLSQMEADLTRAREEAGALRDRLREQKAYWQRVVAHDADEDRTDQCFDVIQEEAGSAIVLIDAALSGSTSTETSPAREGETER